MPKSGIQLTKVWFDDDMIELQIEVSDGTSVFVNRVYVGHSVLAEVVGDLNVFKDQIHGGLLDVRFGEFGPEYADGGFQARLHFSRPDQLCITCRQQSDYNDFAQKQVAGEATMYLKTEPALLDNFIGELRGLSTGNREEAYLEAI